MGIAQIMALIIQLLPTIAKLVKVAEQAFSDTPKSGVIKAAMVNGALQAIVEGGQAVSTGGAKATWSEIAPAIQGAVKIVADVSFKPDLFAQEPPE
jgi:hypothetical protein